MKNTVRLSLFIATSLLALPASAVSGQNGASVRNPRLETIVDNGKSAGKVDILFVADGYTTGEQRKFFASANKYSKELFKLAPFSWYKNKFNVRALFASSRESGAIIDRKKKKPDTLLKSYFDRPKGRLLQFGDKSVLRRLVRQGGQVDIVFVMVNVKKYGGAGTVLRGIGRGNRLPAPTFAANNKNSFGIAVHELGHSFTNLADTYVDLHYGKSRPMPRGNRDFRQANITVGKLLLDKSFAGLKKTVKWKHFLELPGAAKYRWLWAGGHYRNKGVFRPWKNCLMRSFSYRFCPVCMEEMVKAIFKSCGENFDHDAYHKAHPLSFWGKGNRRRRI